MCNRIIFFTVVLLCIVRAQAAFSPAEARHVYDGLSANNSPVIEKGDYVFLKVQWKAPSSDEEDGEELAELEAVENAIRDFVFVGRKLSDKEAFEYKVPEVSSTVVRDMSDENPRCKVFAFEAAPLCAERQRLNPDATKGADETPFWMRFLLFWNY